MPRIHMTRTVKVALYFLRVYLIVLLGLILVKFVLLFSGKSSPTPATEQRSIPAGAKQ
jgi:hypothetical protein